MTTPRSIVIVGASLAGAKAAETLREEGYDGRLVLLGDEPERPYERPPLSKDYLRGESGREAVYVHEAGFYDESAIELRSGTRATVVASARGLGMEVTVLERLAVPLENVLGSTVGGLYADLHRERGVELLTGVELEALEGAGRVERARLADGRTIDCSAVVVGVGVVPRTELAEAAGLAVGDGILVDATLRASAPDVYAAGDVAGAMHPFYGRRVRVEHWANALNQGPAAARSMLGGEEPYDRIPYFFSDQYDVGMEYSGLARDPTGSSSAAIRPRGS